ncbi:MAG TPA: flagellin [Gemmatimonadaceae bacterium]|jgi:flagellin
MRINTNVSALNTLRSLGKTESAVSSSMAKLSSGFRINKSGDDAAGLGIANKLNADVRASSQASRNAEQAGSVLQIMDGATQSVQSILERMKELATQSASDSVDSNARTRINQEFSDLRSEIGRTVDTTKFQGNKLLDGGFGNSIATSGSTALASGTNFQDAQISGANAGAYTLTNTAAGKLTLTNGTVTETATVSGSGKQNVSFASFGITVSTTNSYDNSATSAANGASGLTVSVAPGSTGGAFMVSSSGSYTTSDMISLSTVDLKTASGAGELDLDSSDLTTLSNSQSALTKIDSAIGQLNTYIGKIGAAQNRVDYAQTNLKTSIQNFSAAESVIKDVDMADEMTTFSKNQILQQAGTAMLAQANQMGQGVLTLLRG